MELIPKLANIVVLGNFNPGILTANFLQETCKIPLKDPKVFPQNPIESVVVSEKVTFIASLERFEVSEIDLKSFEGTKIHEYARTYLDTLRYTPVVAWGMNLNVDVKDINPKALQTHFLEDHSAVAKLLKAEQLVIKNEIKFVNGSKEISKYGLRFVVKASEIHGNVAIRINPDKTYNLKYNYEIRKKTDFGLIKDQYKDRLKDFQRFVEGITHK